VAEQHNFDRLGFYFHCRAGSFCFLYAEICRKSACISLKEEHHNSRRTLQAVCEIFLGCACLGSWLLSPQQLWERKRQPPLWKLLCTVVTLMNVDGVVSFSYIMLLLFTRFSEVVHHVWLITMLLCAMMNCCHLFICHGTRKEQMRDECWCPELLPKRKVHHSFLMICYDRVN